MARPRFSREEIFPYLSMECVKKEEIKKRTGIGEATYWRIKKEFDLLDDTVKLSIKKEAEAWLRSKWATTKFIDYEEVQKWVARMQAEKLKSWKQYFNFCQQVWKILQKKHPMNWTEDDIKIRAIPQLRKTRECVFDVLVAIRSLRPDLKGSLSTKKQKYQPKILWKYIFERIMRENKLETFFRVGGFKAELIKRLHVTLGCREGSRGIGGILGLEWDRVNWDNKTIDVYEPKNGEGFYWLNCPLDLFGDRAFEMLQQYWKEQGKPASGKIFGDIGYHILLAKQSMLLADIYEESAEAIGEKYGKEGITPHFARKLHVCLLIEAGVSLEMVAGDSKAHLGIMGVGWSDLKTLRDHYLAFSKAKIEESRNKARAMNL